MGNGYWSPDPCTIVHRPRALTNPESCNDPTRRSGRQLKVRTIFTDESTSDLRM